MRQILFLLVFLSLLSAQAAVTPNCMQNSVDSALFNETPAREFLAKRNQDAACTQKYQKAKKDFDDARAKLQQAVAANAPAAEVDAREADLDSLRAPYLTALSECGPCVAHPSSAPVTVTSGDKTQFWYVSDGSCQLPTTDKAALAHVFERFSDLLVHTTQYPRNAKAGSGFHPILTLNTVDPANGQPTNVDKIPPDGSSIFMAIQGPLSTAFSSFFQVSYKYDQQAGQRLFTMHQEGVSLANTRPPRALTYLSASGKKKIAINSMLPHANGQWFVNDDGYLRYCAAIDFGMKSSFAENFGRTILLDILSTATEKAQTSAAE